MTTKPFNELIDKHYPPGTERRERFDRDVQHERDFVEANIHHWRKHSKKLGIEFCPRAECLKATQDYDKNNPL